MTRQKQELIDENPDSKNSPQKSVTEDEENKDNSEEKRNENKNTSSISETFDEEFEAAEIERLFGPVDDKHHDVEQV